MSGHGRVVLVNKAAAGRCALAASLGALLGLGLISSAHAAKVVDQSSLVPSNVPNVVASQVSSVRPDVFTFTAGQTGKLDEVDLQLYFGGATGSFNLSLDTGDYAQAAG